MLHLEKNRFAKRGEESNPERRIRWEGNILGEAVSACGLGESPKGELRNIKKSGPGSHWKGGGEEGLRLVVLHRRKASKGIARHS